jgi:NADPH:quinone reductase-like Zn-dependent oxidoreductase
MMKAVIINSYGGPGVLQIVDVPRPQITADEMLVRVHAAAINPQDTFIRKGRFKRFTGNHFPMLPGFDFAGEVAETDSRIEAFQEGDTVYGMLDGWQRGTCAEYVAVTPNQVAQQPSSLTETTLPFGIVTFLFTDIEGSTPL